MLSCLCPLCLLYRSHLPHLRCACSAQGAGILPRLLRIYIRSTQALLRISKSPENSMANDTNAKSDPFNDKASEPTGDRADDDQDNQCFQCHVFSPKFASRPRWRPRSVRLNTKAVPTSTACAVTNFGGSAVQRRMCTTPMRYSSSSRRSLEGFADLTHGRDGGYRSEHKARRGRR